MIIGDTTSRGQDYRDDLGAARLAELEILADMVVERLGARILNRISAESRWLTVDEVAEKLQVSAASVYRMVESGEIPAHRVGRCIRINEAELGESLQQYQEV